MQSNEVEDKMLLEAFVWFVNMASLSTVLGLRPCTIGGFLRRMVDERFTLITGIPGTVKQPSLTPPLRSVQFLRI